MGDAVATDGATDRGADDDLARRVLVLDDWIDPSLRSLVEERYWAPIERLTSLESMVADPAFVADPGRHIGLYSDHGPNHARDVAARAATIAGWAVGTLIPERSEHRAEFVAGAAVMISLLHDVGMCTDPPVGRRLHAPYASQLVCSDGFSDVLERILATDAGRLGSGVARAGVADADVGRTVREVLACAVAHSKSTVPTRLLDDRAGLRSLLQYVERTELASQLDPSERTVPDDGTYTWLVDPAVAALAEDVTDAIRIVRAADALRQRGTTLRTSAGFEVVVDARSGRAVAALRSGSGRSTFLLGIDTPIVVGEANIRGAELGPDGVEFQFHRGALSTAGTADAVADAVAGVVDDIQRDILPSFPGRDLGITLLAPQDDPRFAEWVRDRFTAHRPELSARVAVAPGPPTHGREAAFRWSERGRPPSADRRAALLDLVARHGVHRAEDAMFDGAVLVDVDAGERVIAPGEAASFVVVPLADGLQVEPLGGYRPVDAAPYVPIGTIGVLRGHDRNSAVVAGADTEVLVVPADVYLARWAEPYDAAALVERVTRGPLP